MVHNWNIVVNNGNMGVFHSHGGILIAGWVYREDPNRKWMMPGGTPTFGHLRMNKRTRVIKEPWATNRATPKSCYQHIQETSVENQKRNI